MTVYQSDNFIKKITSFQNEEILILNKPFGLAVQGGTGIENHLDGYLKSAFFNSSFSPRLVHRLDKETTGVLVVALTRKIAVYLSNLFQERKVNAHNLIREAESLVTANTKTANELLVKAKFYDDIYDFLDAERFAQAAIEWAEYEK